MQASSEEIKKNIHSSPNPATQSQKSKKLTVLIEKSSAEEATEARQTIAEEKVANETENLFWATVWLSVATILLFCATVLLGFFAFRQGKDFVIHSKQELRAYIGAVVSDDRCAKIRANGNIWTVAFYPIIKNMGKTPAYKMWYEIFGFAEKNPLPAGFTYPPFPKTNCPIIVLAPGQEIQIEYPMPPAPKEAVINFLNSKTQEVYVFGVVHYEDAFGHPHDTEFSYHVGMSYPFITEFNKNMLVCEWRATEGHNNAR